MTRPNLLLAAILLGLSAGVLVGWLAGPSAVAVLPLGTFFLNALKMVVVPLIVTSMIVGVSALGDVRRVGATGARTLAYFLSTTAIAVGIGLVLVNLLEPGAGLSTLALEVPERIVGKDPSAWQVLLSLVHPSLVQAAADGQVLPLLVFCLVFGAVLTTLGARGEVVLGIIGTLNDALMRVVGLILWLAPVGIFGLVAGQIGKHGGLVGFLPVLRALAVYSTTVVAGLALHGLLVLPLLLWFVGRRAPWPFLQRSLPALTTAFSTASSSATLPVSLQCTIEGNRVSGRIARFVVPLGATVNMDGTALYEAVAAIFIAQAYGIHLSLGQQVLVFALATLAAIGAAGIPEAGLVTMVMVLTAVGLPLEGVALLLPIDWLLDRFRTTVNVWGDNVGAAVVARLASADDEPGEATAC